MKLAKRFGIYFIGMIFLAAGITLNAKTGLGASPRVSMAYCASLLDNISFSDATMVLYLLYFVVEMFLKVKKITWRDFLQVPFCYLFTRCMDVISNMLPSPEHLPLRVVMLVTGTLCTGFGTAITVACRLVPTPADGLVSELSRTLHQDIGITKNLFDCTCVCIVALASLALTGSVTGIGVGTIIAMLGTGRAISLCNWMFYKKIRKIVKKAPITIIGEKKRSKSGKNAKDNVGTGEDKIKKGGKKKGKKKNGKKNKDKDKDKDKKNKNSMDAGNTLP